MSRPARIEYPGAFYHVMNRGRGKSDIFHDASYFEAFLATLAEACQRFGLRVHAYCLMSNHYHLLVETPDGNLQRAMRHVGGVYTQRYNRLKQTDGSLFRGRYKAILIDSDEYLLHLSKYIHLNPLQANMVENLTAYPWSSYPSYIGKGSGERWLVKELVYEQLSGKRSVAARYKAYVEESPVLSEVDAFYGKQRMAPVLGSNDFVRSIGQYADVENVEIVRQDVVSVKPDLDEVIKSVAEIYSLNVSDLLISKKGRGVKNRPRKVAMYLLQRLCGLKLTEIAEHFGLRHYGGVASSIHAVKQDLVVDKTLGREINIIIKRFDP